MHKGAIFLLFIFTAVCLQAQTGAAVNETAIRTARAVSNTAIAKHDVEGMMKNVAPEIVLVTGNALQFVGKNEVKARWEELFAKSKNVAYLRTPLQITISKNDTLAWETGKWTALHSYSGGGNYTAMWCKRNGVWLTRAELFVSLEK